MAEEFRPRLSKEEFDLIKSLRMESNGSPTKRVENHNTFNREGIHIVSGCHHVPAHNKYLMDGMLELAKDLGKDLVGFHLAGDFLDMASISRHSKGTQSTITLTQEYNAGNKVLDAVRDAVNPDADLTYIWGNHEDWYNQHMAKIDNAKLGKGVIKSPTEALRLHERGFHVYENWKEDSITLGRHLDVMHGVYCNVHAAKKHIDTFRRSVMFVHTHRMQTFIEGDTAGFNIGFMGDLNSPAFGYAPRAMKSKWNNGFAIVHIDSNGRFFVTPILAFDDCFYYRGKRYGRQG